MTEIIQRLEDLIGRLRRKIKSKAAFAREVIYEDDLSDGVWANHLSDFEEEGEEVILSQADSSHQGQEHVVPVQQ